VKAVSVAADEKWLKIHQRWHYWFVGLDEATGLPVVLSLLPTRTTWACCWFLVTLKRLGKIPRSSITDGLAGYAASVPIVFPTAKHLACLFHHPQGIPRWLRKHAANLPQEAVTRLTRKMKHVVQTCDPRTVHRRLTRLAPEEGAQQCGLESWIAQTRKWLGQLIPALRRNAYPHTTNSIERFFRAVQRFYKTRGGFHSVRSAKQELMLFVVVYVFTIQASTGIAPLEHILPQAKQMPLYTLLNNPFRYGLANMCQVKRASGAKMTTQQAPLPLRNP
jgi:transposase-like protein